MAHILSEIPQILTNFVTDEMRKNETRAKKCGCPSCRTDFKDALDRQDWLNNLKRWERKKLVGIIQRKGQRLQLYADGTFAPDD